MKSIEDFDEFDHEVFNKSQSRFKQYQTYANALPNHKEDLMEKYAMFMVNRVQPYKDHTGISNKEILYEIGLDNEK